MALITRVRARAVSTAGGLMLLGLAMTPHAAVAQASVGPGYSTVLVPDIRPHASAFVAPRRDELARTITLSRVAATVGDSSNHTLRNALIGAVVGGAILGGVAAAHAARCEDCFFQGPIVTIAVGIGAGLGGLIGSAISSD